MTDHIFKQERGWLEQAIARVYDGQHDGEDAMLLAMFADGVLRNLTDTVLKPAWLGTKKLSPEEARERAAGHAAKVFMTSRHTNRPPHESLELAYWAYYAESEAHETGNPSKSVSVLGPTPETINHALAAWLTGNRDVAAPLASHNVDYLKLKSTVMPALNEFGFGIEAREADWFKKTKMATRRK